MERSNNDYPTEYIDIVNEINDFIASLDAPPLDNHTNELVGNAQRVNTFGQHDEGGYPGTAWSRSRHGSGEKGQTLPSEEDVCDKTVPFPLLEENAYDYIGSDRSRSTDFRDSDYSDISVVSGDTADSDSGCYSHYHVPRSDAVAVSGDLINGSTSVKQASSCPSNFSSGFTSSPHSLSGHAKAPPYLTSPSSSPRHVQQQFIQPSLRPQSPDRASAEFRCDSYSDSIDHKFHQVGSSAHSLAASLGRAPVWNSADDHDYQEPSNIPKVPESPVPQRRSPTKANKPQEHCRNPLSTSPSLPSDPHTPKTSQEATRDNVYSVISKASPSKLNIKTRWPPASQNSDSPLPESTCKPNNIVTPQKQARENKLDELNTEPPKQPPVNRVPDLSVLISELRSASPRSELSPNSKFTASARSERGPLLLTPNQTDSHSAKPGCGSPSKGVANQPSKGEGCALKQTSPEAASPDRQSRQCKQPSSRQRSESQSPISVHRRGPTGASGKHIANGGRCKSESPEHDYEPIENLLELEVPATPRPQTKFPHGQGQRAMAESGGQQPKHVKAIHSFKGSNNDELCFKKGDIITVTQCWDEGWWEGTLNGRTGWFPSNYMKEIKAELSYKNNKTGDVPVYKRESMQLYHNVVLKNVIETEKTHVTEMIKVLQLYIKPIESTNILTPPEYTLLIGNLEEIIAFQQSFLVALEECEKLPPYQRRIGGIFMQFAQTIKELYLSYCSNHPKAVSILQKKREDLSKFVEAQGAPAPGAQTLITILSKPFTRLEKYPSLLKELERHVEESHPDRGDTQRAIAVYRTINNSCVEIRRLKEMEHEIITSVIQGWEGEEISKLGEVVHLSQVKMVTQTGEKFERIFVLFPTCLVMLSMTPRLSSYQYEGKIPLSGLTSNPCETADVSQNAFELSGPMIEKITVLCGTKSEVTAWLDILTQQTTQSGNPSPSSKPQSLQVHQISISQPSVSTVVPAKTAQISNNPPKGAPPPFPMSVKASSVWSLTCLRPSPPTRPTLMCRDEVLKSPRAARKTNNKRKPVRTYSGEETDWHSKNDPKVYNEDAFILQVIEAYCNSVKTRNTVNSYKIEGAKKKDSDGKVDLSKLRLSDSSGSAESGAYSESLNSPDLDDYTSIVSGGQPLMGGFCCATFPLTRGLARTIKRL